VQIANFHNTIADRILPSLLPFMLQDALELEKMVQTDVMTWKDTRAVESYIQRLSTVVENLGKNTTRLTHYHLQVKDKVYWRKTKSFDNLTTIQSIRDHSSPQL
jgi:dynein heavy chain 2